MLFNGPNNQKFIFYLFIDFFFFCVAEYTFFFDELNLMKSNILLC